MDRRVSDVSSVNGASPAGPDDLARVAALRRLDLRESLPTAAFDDLVGLIARTLAADAVSIVIVEHARAWTIASTSTFDGAAEIPRSWSLADILVTSPDPLLVVPAATQGNEGARQLRLADPELPTTLAAYAIEAPSGERIGAIEVVWEDRHDIGDEPLSYLERCSSLVTHMLHLGAEVSEYGRFVDLTPDPVVILDLEGAIEQVNPAFASLIGARDSELIGRAFLDLVARVDRARVTAELSRALFMQRRHGQLELTLIDEEGGTIPCSVSAGHLRGPRRHMQLVVHDLSERLRAEDERSRLSEQLARAQRLDAVGQIAGGLAHDLNNLLMVMVSNLSLARESIDLAVEGGDPSALETVRHDLEEVEVAVDRAGGLTSKLLQFARQEEGAEDQADVAEVVGAAVRLVGRSLGEHIGLEVAVTDEVPLVVADPLHLERVIVNLLINAREAITGEQGSIRIEVEEVPAPSPSGSASARSEAQHTGDVRITVRDDGRGMDETTRARAFEPLFTTRSDAGGSGLGLATVLAFVEETDGEVTLDSAPGEGTAVTLVLPAKDESQAGPPIGVDVPVAGARVLLVDPGERTRRVISTMLTGSGYRVRAVASAEAALELLEGVGADLLITELALPGRPGTRLIQDVQERQPDLPCLVIAPVGQSTTLRGTPVLAKPFSHTRLLRAVEDLVRQR